MSKTTLQQDGIIRDEAYNVLEKEIKEHLIKQLEMGKMDVKKVAEVSFLLGQAKTAEGLQFLIDNLKNDFEVIEEIKDEQENDVDISVDQIVQKYVADLLKENPLKASEVGLKATQEGVTLKQLIQEFPDLKNYI